MQRLPWIGVVLALTLAACGKSPDSGNTPPAPSVPTVERPGPVRWNMASGGFELNGKPLKAVKLWTFDGSTEGYTGVGSKVIPAVGSGVSVTIADPILRSPKGLNVPGGQYPLVLVRLTRIAPAVAWDGALYYATAGHTESISYLGKPMSGANPAVGETTTLVYDMAHQTLGGPDWVQSTIDQIRLDLEDRPGGAFLIRQIAIAENPDPAVLGPTAPPAEPAASAPLAPATSPVKPKS